jgi:signal transduction histidine kinase
VGAFCREAFSELRGVNWTLLELPSQSNMDSADLIIWDLQPGGPEPELDQAHPECQNVFLVHHSRLEWLCRHLPIAAAVSIFVEPAQPAEMREFLLRGLRRRLAASLCPGARKSDRDDLFQAFLLAGVRLSEVRSEQIHLFRRVLHDLAVPLTAVSGYCGLLLDQQLGAVNEGQLDVLRQMQDSVDQLSSLTDAVRHLSRGGLDPAELFVQPGDVTTVLDRAVFEAFPAAQAREIEICVDAVPPDKVFHFDSVLIQRVLLCILSNACRFTSPHGAIEVSGYPFDLGDPREEADADVAGNRQLDSSGTVDAYRIDIRDFGVPIPPESLPKVFDVSSDGGGGYDRSQGGLEMALCKLIVEAHQGEIRVESGESGTVFSVILASPQAASTSEHGRQVATAGCQNV